MEVELGEFHPKSPRNDTTYSDAPKSGRPVFGAFDLCPVCESSGYRTSGSFQFGRPVIGRPVPIASNRTSDTKPVPNRFQTGLEPVLYL